MQRFVATSRPMSVRGCWVGMMLRCGKISCVAGLLLALVAGAGSAAAQDKPEAPTPKTPSTPQSQAASKQNPSAAPGLTAPQDQNPKRILGIIPNFETKNDTPAGYEPMSVKEKYVLAWHQSVDFSAHFGNAFQAAPQQDRSASAVFQNWGVNLAYTSAYNVLKEFYPDFLRIVFHKHRERADGTPAN